MPGDVTRTLDLVASRIANALMHDAQTMRMRGGAEVSTLRHGVREKLHVDRANSTVVERQSSALETEHAPRIRMPNPRARKRTFEPSRGELAMRRRSLIGPPPGQRPSLADPRMNTHEKGLDGRFHEKQVWRMRSTDGRQNVFKPISGEFPARYGIPTNPGDLARRELAAYRVDSMLGFDLVPPAALIKGPKGYGDGVVMQFVESAPGRSYGHYHRADQQRMGVLDYIIGNTDRHVGNYRTLMVDGRPRPVAIDHAQSFPESPDGLYGIRSDFTKAHLNQTLDRDVLQAVKSLHPDRLRAGLQDAGLSDKAVDGAVSRLQEIQRSGKITKENWPSEVTWSEGNKAQGFHPYETGRQEA